MVRPSDADRGRILRKPRAADQNKKGVHTGGVGIVAWNVGSTGR